MEYYHYVNIFETKGLEYILVICFLITFVIFVRRLNMPPKGATGGPPGALAGGKVIVVPEEPQRDNHGEPSAKRTTEIGESRPPGSPNS
ncbi:MAG: hypothetical protein GXP47_11405 [Acidobacteria bacterium]|nr:hypothetical protein [Acidobacteriota bacterium]